VFERADGGLAVLEYNCDKPTSQREIWAAAEAWPGRANPSRAARDAFSRELAREWRRHLGRGGAPVVRARKDRPRVAVLVEPGHREELHLAYLFGREIDRLGWPWEVVGPDNLIVVDGWPSAYGERVDVVLRQYPTEFLHELPAMGALWRCTLAGRLLWVNDPRAALAQAKSTLALLWERARAGNGLTRADARLVLGHLPATGLASTAGWLDRASTRREDWVVKPVFGRFSEGVTLGALATTAEWDAAVAQAAAHPEQWIVQAYVPPRRRWLPTRAAGQGGYVNWGVYLAGGAPAGLLARLQPTPLTRESTSWWSPIRLRPAPRRARTAVLRGPVGPAGRDRWPGPGPRWLDIADRSALAGYTNVWTDGLANFGLSPIAIAPAEWDALVEATRGLDAAFGRVLAHLAARPELASVLGLSPRLARLAASSAAASPWSFLSRLDWGRTPDGGWRLLEVNADTPAGLWEAALVAGEVARLHGARPAGGDGFWPTLAASWRRWTERLLGVDAAAGGLRVGVVGDASVPEDMDQMRAHAHAARLALPAATIDLGATGDVSARDGRAWLHGAPVDLLFRYYPLHWLEGTAEEPLLALAEAGVPMLPPPHALLAQSKAFLALVWELCGQGFFPAAEAATVRAHLPATVLDPARLGRRRHVVKPYLEHEGRGVRFGEELTPAERRRVRHADAVYQERVDLARARVPVATARGWRTEDRVLVFGVFLAGAEVPGVYTRAGAAITGREAVFVPLVIR
jgi:glutathionylspermidine synthase